MIQEVTDLDPQTLQVTQPWSKGSLNYHRKVHEELPGTFERYLKNTPAGKIFHLSHVDFFSGLTPTSFRSSVITQINNMYTVHIPGISFWTSRGKQKKSPPPITRTQKNGPWSFWTQFFFDDLPLKDRIMRQVCRGEGGLCESKIGMVKTWEF